MSENNLDTTRDHNQEVINRYMMQRGLSDQYDLDEDDCFRLVDELLKVDSVVDDWTDIPDAVRETVNAMLKDDIEHGSYTDSVLVALTASIWNHALHRVARSLSVPSGCMSWILGELDPIDTPIEWRKVVAECQQAKETNT